MEKDRIFNCEYKYEDDEEGELMEYDDTSPGEPLIVDDSSSEMNRK
jgi:hypothetical protein